jgi:hypothetical protein
VSGPLYYALSTEVEVIGDWTAVTGAQTTVEYPVVNGDSYTGVTDTGLDAAKSYLYALSVETGSGTGLAKSTPVFYGLQAEAAAVGSLQASATIADITRGAADKTQATIKWEPAGSLPEGAAYKLYRLEVKEVDNQPYYYSSNSIVALGDWALVTGTQTRREDIVSSPYATYTEVIEVTDTVNTAKSYLYALYIETTDAKSSPSYYGLSAVDTDAVDSLQAWVYINFVARGAANENPADKTKATISWYQSQSLPEGAAYKLSRREVKEISDRQYYTYELGQIVTLGDWTPVTGAQIVNSSTISVVDTGLSAAKSYLYALSIETADAKAKSTTAFYGLAAASTTITYPQLGYQTSTITLNDDGDLDHYVTISWNAQANAAYTLERAVLTPD